MAQFVTLFINIASFCQNTVVFYIIQANNLQKNIEKVSLKNYIKKLHESEIPFSVEFFHSG